MSADDEQRRRLETQLAELRRRYMAETWAGHDMIAAEWAHEADLVVFRIQLLDRDVSGTSASTTPAQSAT